ncbi:hypothetical protein FMEAI12_4010004 [Parafrankia sp. Ea1.12]|nr:hypothetical protein FMEAI12_4010004 [Parafrankia sp. Ea1.12]
MPACRSWSAGLDRVNVSLDTTSPDRFRAITAAELVNRCQNQEGDDDGDIGYRHEDGPQLLPDLHVRVRHPRRDGWRQGSSGTGRP